MSIARRSLRDGRRILFLLVPLLCLSLTPVPSSAQTDVESIYRFGLQQLEDGDIDNAINTFRKVLELNPDHALAHSSLGYIYLRRGRIELARPSFEAALRIDPNLAAAHNGMGLVQAREVRTRDAALESFRRALSLDPRYLDAHYNMGVTLAGMERYGAARDEFGEVLRSEPGYRDIHYRLGLIAMASKDYDVAETEFSEQYRMDPSNRENRLELGRLFFVTERYENAEDILYALMAQNRDYVPAMVLLADVYLAVEDYERANQLYLQSYRDFDDEETADRLWGDVVDIAYDFERDQFEKTELEDMPAFFRKFWLRRDTDPTTAENDVLVEHYKRLRYARQYFSSPVSRGGYDDRGRVYVKHGEPDQVVDSSVGDAETRPNITWEYHTARKERLILHFVDRGNGVFNEVTTLMEASMTIPLGILPQTTELGTEASPTAELWVDRIPIQAYRDRADIDPIYDRIANMMEDLQRASQGPGGGPDVARTYQERLERLVSEERMETLRDITTVESTSSYENLLPPNPLPFNFYTAAFRDIQNKTRLEVYYGLPVSEVGFERYADGQKVTVDLGVSVHDMEWNEIARINERREYVSGGPVRQELGSAIVDLNRMVVEPGVYYFAISVTDRLTGRNNVYADSLRIEDFRARELSLSDIEIAGNVEESNRGGKFYREGLEITPLPSRTFTTDQKIWIYYEMYNLSKDDFGTTNFNLSYTIQPASEGQRRNIISSAFRSLGRLVGLGKNNAVTVELDEEFGIRPQENKYLELAFPNPSPGIYEIKLLVKDLIAGTQAERIQLFMVTPPADGR